MAGVEDVGGIISGFGNSLIAHQTEFKYGLLGIMVFLFGINLKYIIKGTEAFFMTNFAGKKKMSVIGNDKTKRSMWVDFREDFKIYSEKAYIHDKNSIIINEFGEQEEVFVQDYTEPVEFKPYKKYVWVDKKTNEPLRDKDGKYVTRLNFLEFVAFKYRKEINEEFKKIEDLVQPTLIDNVVAKETKITSVLFPMKITDHKKGIDTQLTASVIVRRMKIDALGWLSKYWKQVMLFGIIVMVGTLVIFALTYGNGTKLDEISKLLQTVASNTNKLLNPQVS